MFLLVAEVCVSMFELPSVRVSGWPLYMVLTVFFWAMPVIFLNISWDIVVTFFCAAVGTKWFVFASMDFISQHPDESVTLHQFFTRE